MTTSVQVIKNEAHEEAMRPLRILHIRDHSIPMHSGYSFRSPALLTEQRRLGCVTHHLTTPTQGMCTPEQEEFDGWLFHRTQANAAMTGIRGYFNQMSATQMRIESLATTLKPDILHPHSPVLSAIPAIRAGRKLGLPVVYEMRASWEDAAVDHGTTRQGSSRYKISRNLETFALRQADAITMICDGLRTDILARGDIDPRNVTFIPNAVNGDSFAYEPAADLKLRRSLGLENCAALGFAGSLYGYEGLGLLPHTEVQRY